MMQGVVKFYNNEKGYGFIRPGANEPDVFFHVRQLIGGTTLIEEGDIVTVDVEPDRRTGRMAAVDVQVVQ
jgi:CspA family cold shock protein